MKKQIISIVFIFILIAPVISIYVLFEQKRITVREEVKERILRGIDREELVLLKFTEDQSQRLLKWEHSKEFEYEGEMYDIVDMSVDGDTILYLCLKDHEETRLKKDLADLVSKSMQQDTWNKTGFDSLNRLFSSLYFQNNKIPALVDTQKWLVVSGDYPDNYDSVIFAPPTPPPQSC